MTVIQGNNDKTRVGGLLTQTHFTYLSRDHSITLLSLRCDECCTSSLLKDLSVTVIDNSESIARNLCLLCLVITEEFILVSESKLLHARHHHLSDLLLLDPFLNFAKRDKFILSDS
jgi:hypothetical protein